MTFCKGGCQSERSLEGELPLINNLLLASFFLVLSTSSASAVYYVKSSGSDNYTCPEIQNENTPARNIQKAVDCVAETGSGAGEEIRVYSGSYLTFGIPQSASGAEGAYLIIRANPGDTATIDNGPLGDDFNIDVSTDVNPTSYIHIEGFEVTTSNNLNAGFSIGYGSNIRIRNNHIHHTGVNCVHAESVHDLQLSGNWMHHCGLLRTENGGGHGVYLSGTTRDAVIDNNLIEDGEGWGIHVYGLGTGAQLARITISNNVVRNNASTGIGCLGVYADTEDNYCNIFDNTVINNAVLGVWTAYNRATSVYNNNVSQNGAGDIFYDSESNELQNLNNVVNGN
jgi:parallel beta-helix repeat protein